MMCTQPICNYVFTINLCFIRNSVTGSHLLYKCIYILNNKWSEYILTQDTNTNVRGD